MKSKTFWRTFCAFAATLLFTVVLIAVLMVTMVRSERMRALEEEVRTQAYSVSQLLEQRDVNLLFRTDNGINATIEWKMKEILENYGADIWIVNSNGYVIARGSSDQSTIQERLDDPEVMQQIYRVLSGEEIRVQGLFSELGDHIITIGVPWRLANQVMGAVLLHISVDSLEVDYSDIVTKVSIAGVLALLVGTVMAYWITRKQLLPIKEISSAVSDFASGNLERRVEIKGNDEMAQLAASFNQMAQDLANLEESRKSFVASVSHELRSPLTCIQGYIQGMQDGTIPPEEQGKYMDVVISETKRLTKLVAELLDLSRFESGKFPLNRKVFDVNELIACALIKYEKQIEDKGISVEVAFRDNQCMVYADSDRINQVVTNLIDNAVKFLSQGGQLNIKTHSVDDLCYVTIQDTGIGIAPDDLPFIFDRFYKADKAHTSGKGTGLGLSIVKKILEQHGQTIQVTSTLGKGTSFVFTLPLADKN